MGKIEPKRLISLQIRKHKEFQRGTWGKGSRDENEEEWWVLDWEGISESLKGEFMQEFCTRIPMWKRAKWDRIDKVWWVSMPWEEELATLFGNFRELEKKVMALGPPKSRAAELGWIAGHIECLTSKFKGHWLILEGSKLFSAHRDLRVAADKARKEGVRFPFVYRIPEDDEDPVVV